MYIHMYLHGLGLDPQWKLVKSFAVAQAVWLLLEIEIVLIDAKGIDLVPSHSIIGRRKI